MKAINRQKFLAELAKLLTFMYEEDRLYALEMYERMFDIAEDDEQELIQHLVSPTRQAVMIARAYDAKERKLSVNAQWKEEDSKGDGVADTPPFVLAINKIFDDLFPEEKEERGLAENQISFVELGLVEEETPKKTKMPKAAVLLDDTQEFPAFSNSESSDEDSEMEELLEQSVDKSAETAFEPVAEDVSSDESSEDGIPNTERTDTDSADIEDAPTILSGEADLSNENPLEEATQQLRKERKKHSIEDLLGFRRKKIDEEEQTKDPEECIKLAEHSNMDDKGNAAEQQGVDELAPRMIQQEEEGKPEGFSPHEKTGFDQISVPEERPDSHWSFSAIDKSEHEKTDFILEASLTKRETTADSYAEQVLEISNKSPDNNLPEEAEEPVIKKPEKRSFHRKETLAKRVRSTPKFVLFLLVAIPVMLVLILFLLIPTLLCMGLACGLIALGAVLIVSAFSGFAVLADIMMLLGAALAALALGLLALWIAVWLVGSVLAELLNRVHSLCEKWCYKEVPAE
ncbi:MAG: hypothetical protein IJV40_06815 [Oscillospiraceae bacterium]|nr:hypothetical protein [Oscillospiraceae bacterium]